MTAQDAIQIIRSRRTILPDGECPAAVHIGAGGAIVHVGDYDDLHGGESVDLGDRVLMPGVVDTHVHVNEPGRTEWEGFETATRAAAAGGVTTIVDMPLNSVPATTTVEALEAKRRAACGRAVVDVGFWGGVVPGNAAEIAPLARAGVLGFKCFLVPSGVDEFPHVNETDLRAAAAPLADAGLPLLVHAELPRFIDADWAGRSDPRSYRAYVASRPPDAEVHAIEAVAALARDYGIHVHIVHVSSARGVDAIEAAQRAGVPITGETCPHYLFASADQVADGATLWKCAPPIRSREDREGLWSGLDRGVITLVASDHSPSPASLKCLDAGDFSRAWGGIASLQLALSIVWTAAASRGYAVGDVTRWMSAAPAALAGLTHRKGAIVPGVDADLIAFDPDARFVVRADALWHRHPVTPYVGLPLRGRVEQTWVRGRLVYEHGAFHAGAGALLA